MSDEKDGITDDVELDNLLERAGSAWPAFTESTDSPLSGVLGLGEPSIIPSEEVLRRLERLCDGRPGLYAELHARDEVLEVLFGLLATFGVVVE